MLECVVVDYSEKDEEIFLDLFIDVIDSDEDFIFNKIIIFKWKVRYVRKL